MIVEPGFLDHWKTQALIRATNDPSAPLMLFRLWEHCQLRKTSRFSDLSDAALASICRWSKKPDELRAILIETGFIRMEGQKTIVHDWDVTNRILVSAWSNGRFGGRPRKRLKTDRKPVGNRPLTDRKPGDQSSQSILSSVQEEDLKGKPPALVPTAENIYDAYPLKVGKPDALNAIKRCFKKFGQAFLLERTIAFANSRNGDTEYCPHPATWFNQERFNDDPETWKPKQPGQKKKPLKPWEKIPQSKPRFNDLYPQ